ncbi:CRE-PRX-5 protein [Aphelenchoides avenae]|nr:CRE-PRX-5 protein [Aphelenchus avenae]
MQSTKALLEPQCGTVNPLVGLAQNYGQSNARLTSGAERQLQDVMPSVRTGDFMAQEYLTKTAQQTSAPMTFNMKALVQQLPSSSASATNLAKNWSNEFAKAYPQQQSANALHTQWVQQYNVNAPGTTNVSTVYNDAWKSASATTMPSMFSTEYLDRFDDDKLKSNALSSQWQNEYLDQVEAGTSSNLQQVPSNDELLREYEQEWDDILQRGAMEAENLSYMGYQEPYTFNSQNPFASEQDAVAKGSEMLSTGNISEAILYYESAVQRNPQDANAWCALGLAQAENEQDVQAIAAFRKSLSIDPKNKEALVGLAVSLANENLDNDALTQLERWIAVYNGEDVAQQNNEAMFGRDGLFRSYLDQGRFEAVESRFLAAARRNAAQSSVDPGLQNALSVLYNLNKNYARAVDSVKAALAVKPDDATLWNRLGATLANGEQTAEAISAYRKALELFPTYVRARYNLGISCMHLHSYREAIEHFLSALRIQRSPETSMIWSTLRSAVIRLNMPFDGQSALMEAVDSRDTARLSAALLNHGMQLKMGSHNVWIILSLAAFVARTHAAPFFKTASEDLHEEDYGNLPVDIDSSLKSVKEEVQSDLKSHAAAISMEDDEFAEVDKLFPDNRADAPKDKVSVVHDQQPHTIEVGPEVIPPATAKSEIYTEKNEPAQIPNTTSLPTTPEHALAQVSTEHTSSQPEVSRIPPVNVQPMTTGITSDVGNAPFAQEPLQSDDVPASPTDVTEETSTNATEISEDAIEGAGLEIVEEKHPTESTEITVTTTIDPEVSFWDKVISGIRCAMRDCRGVLVPTEAYRRELGPLSMARRIRNHDAVIYCGCPPLNDDTQTDTDEQQLSAEQE